MPIRNNVTFQHPATFGPAAVLRCEIMTREAEKLLEAASDARTR
jgi:hypothetical protein